MHTDEMRTHEVNPHEIHAHEVHAHGSLRTMTSLSPSARRVILGATCRTAAAIIGIEVTTYLWLHFKVYRQMYAVSFHTLHPACIPKASEFWLH